MKVEQRCHAVLCKTEEKAKAMAVLLHDKLSFALSEFLREKTRSQNSRLTLQRTNSLPSGGAYGGSGVAGYKGMPLRKKMLSTGQNFKPSVEQSNSAPKLGAISEDLEPEIIEEGEEFDGTLTLNDSDATLTEETEDIEQKRHNRRCSKDDSDIQELERGSSHRGSIDETLFHVEIGNDIEELKKDEKVMFHLAHDDSDDDDSSSRGSESGFSEQESRETSSSGGSSLTDSGIETEGQNEYGSRPDCDEIQDLENNNSFEIMADVCGDVKIGHVSLNCDEKKLMSKDIVQITHCEENQIIKVQL